MGKYMKKPKTVGDVAAVIMEAPSHAPAVGVRTRAKTLALQKSPPAKYRLLCFPSAPESSPPKGHSAAATEKGE
ncbi:hypothetical protein RYX36_023266 [Vicia faba]